MPFLITAKLGMLSFSEEDILTFPIGLPGFSDHRRFLLIQKDDSPIAYLQSVDFPQIRFILLPVTATAPDYELAIEKSDLSILFPSDQENFKDSVSSYFVVSASEPSEPRINMLAPIVLRPGTRTGLQAIRSDSRYSHIAPLAQILGHLSNKSISRC